MPPIVGPAMRPQQRQKLFHAIVFFRENTKFCHKLKLFKLLNAVDFEIFRQTGKPMTGLLYYAWPKGPVPKELFEELRNPKPDMRAAMTVHTPPADDPDSNSALQIYPKIKFDPDCFTPRELEAMERIAEIFRDADGETMSEASHARGGPWHTVAKVQKRLQAVIPYRLILDGRPDSITADQADEIDEETRELAALFG